MKKTKIRWLPKPQRHDYPAAQSYLSLLFPPRVAKALVQKLERAGISEFAAKDIFRASGLAVLGSGNSHVDRDRIQIIHRQPISPILLCRDVEHGKVIIADGYHRLCAVYTFDEDAMIPCQIV
ncbi:MAG: hypothetical protein ACLQAR_03685 [Steroidobacteraceae bacterium]